MSLEWNEASFLLPEDDSVVVAEYTGVINGVNGGLTSALFKNGRWQWVPEDIRIIRWAYVFPRSKK